MTQETVPAKVYKMVISIVDTEGNDPEDIASTIENIRDYNPTVQSIESRDIQWSDNHPLNMNSTAKGAFKELFKD